EWRSGQERRRRIRTVLPADPGVDPLRHGGLYERSPVVRGTFDQGTQRPAPAERSPHLVLVAGGISYRAGGGMDRLRGGHLELRRQSKCELRRQYFAVGIPVTGLPA